LFVLVLGVRYIKDQESAFDLTDLFFFFLLMMCCNKVVVMMMMMMCPFYYLPIDAWEKRSERMKNESI
jgi:hypothetical protein